MDAIINTLGSEHGLWGSVVGVLLIAVGALWKRLCRREDEFYEQSNQTTAALVEFNMIWRDKK